MNQLQLLKNSVDIPNQQSIDVFRLGEVFAKSGYFQDAKDASQAIVKILAGREIGIGAMASMTGFHIVKGKPVLSANLIASIIKNKQSGYNYRVIEMSEKACEIEFFERNESIGKSRFTIDEAKKANLTGKDVWQNFPKNMLFARAISNGAKWFCPDVFNGAAVYTPDEMGADVNSDGELLPEAGTLHQMPTKGHLIEDAKTAPPPTEPDPINKQISDLCTRLNDAKDSIVWKPKSLTEYVNELFDTEVKSFIELNDEKKEVLLGDLEGRLAEIDAIKNENVIEGEFTDTLKDDEAPF